MLRSSTDGDWKDRKFVKIQTAWWFYLLLHQLARVFWSILIFNYSYPYSIIHAAFNNSNINLNTNYLVLCTITKLLIITTEMSQMFINKVFNLLFWIKYKSTHQAPDSCATLTIPRFLSIKGQTQISKARIGILTHPLIRSSWAIKSKPLPLLYRIKRKCKSLSSKLSKNCP